MPTDRMCPPGEEDCSWMMYVNLNLKPLHQLVQSTINLKVLFASMRGLLSWSVVEVASSSGPFLFVQTGVWGSDRSLNQSLIYICIKCVYSMGSLSEYHLTAVVVWLIVHSSVLTICSLYCRVLVGIRSSLTMENTTCTTTSLCMTSSLTEDTPWAPGTGTDTEWRGSLKPLTIHYKVKFYRICTRAPFAPPFHLPQIN